MSNPRRGHGIEDEPHLQPSGHEPDPSERTADAILGQERAHETDNQRVEYNVWEEPVLSPALVTGPGDDQLTYAKWLRASIEKTTLADSLWVSFLVALTAGPWGVLGAFWTALAGNGGAGLLAVVVFGPVTEEVVKIATAWWVVEKRPYLFKSVTQILFCCGCGGLAFAALENLVYMYVYVPDHSAAFVTFRWTVCVGLHVTCSLVAGLGLARVWDNAMRNEHRPRTPMGIPWLVTAMVGHGLYNLSVVVAAMAGWLDFLH